jgi:CRISPR-associated endonuclease/helicase Cas3
MTTSEISPQQPFLRPFQQRVFDCIQHGRSVILQAPTGAGKTRAALAPFVANLARQGNRLPLTCRYVVPMRVLANQFYREYHDLATRIDREAPTRLEHMYWELGLSPIAIQTGEQPDDPQFESILTFCTIDQLLASFLAVPYGVGQRKANLNVGAVAGSYLVLDEPHLYPLLGDGKSVFGARTTTIQMLRLLKSVTPFVLMTATFSTSLLERLAQLLDAAIVTVDDPQELQEIAQGRIRTYQRSHEPMSAQAILAGHYQRENNRCTLVICNTVLRAQQMYLQLRQAEARGTRVVLLHSRFTVEDRRQLSEEVEHELGPDQWKNGIYHGRDIIVVATQVVEVGLDISVQVLHAENAPANGLIQRAGRCARFARQQGSVIVYPLPKDDEGKEASMLPYDKGACSSTWSALEQFDGQQVGFPEEQILINAVHTEEDQDLLKRYSQNEGEILKRIFESFNSNKRGIASTLIRDVSQVQILIHDHPEEAIKEDPWHWQSFSMHPDSLASSRRWEALQEQSQKLGLDWACKEAQPIIKDADSVDNRQKTSYLWQPVTNHEAIPQALVIALPSKLARYDAKLGFVLLDGTLELKSNGYQSTPLKVQPLDFENIGSRQTSYQDHIAGLVHAYNVGIKGQLDYVSCKLELEMGLPSGMVDQAIRLAIACHDLGKLNQQWQEWALAWQKLLYEQQMRPTYALPNPFFCFAKTDNNYSPQQKQLQSQVTPKRPHHACESVAIGRSLIGTSLDISRAGGQERLPVLRAICGAIARHHTSQASEYGSVVLDKHARKAAEEALKIVHQGAVWSYDAVRLAKQIPEGGDLAPETALTPKLTRPELTGRRIDELEALLYFVIVRALRLADQRAG